MRRLFAPDNLLLVLLVFVPVAVMVEYLLPAAAIWVFVTSALAIVPLAGLMGRATEELAARVGAGVGGLLNATFGNAAEVIIAVMALRAGLEDLVKASLTGSIIGNALLVFGLSTLVGGVRYRQQSFNRTAASLSATLLVLSAIGLVVPAIFHRVAGGQAASREQDLSLEIAVILMATYVLGLLFSLKTHRHLYHGGAHEEEEGQRWSRKSALAVLLLSTAFVAWMSELLVGAVEEAAHVLGMSEIFVGVILVAVIGNAAEHSSAVLVAAKNKMDISIHIAAGSSIQIALFVAPLLVFLSYFVGPAPMDLLFTTLEVVAVGAAVGILALIAHDGETHWMEGVQLLAVYAILALAFYFLPT